MRNFIVTINGKSYEVGVEEVGAVASAPVTPVVTAPAAATAAPAAAPKAAPANGTQVKAPFPGLIKSLLVADGATVKKDQPIMVLEAMKMDNDVSAPCDGVVTFSVAKGANVEADAVLAVIG
ncbi:MAG: biotin/lipoyl-containing protein [Christensenellaceae bacterium]